MVTPARRIAGEVLMRVAQGGAFANLALDSALRQAGILEPREAALATELTYGTLRWQLRLDRALAAHSDRALEDLDEAVRVTLRLGAFELLHHEKVPARAAVNEAVARAQEALRVSGIDSRPGRYSPDALILASGAPPALDIEGYEQGLFQAQDEAAQLVSLFAAPDRSARILDACAAPGGKACHLAEIAERGSVLAVDLHARKAAAVGEAARRLGLENLEARAADVTLPIPDVAFESL